ncbi:MAG: BatA domain-containing protein [Ignavibacteriales bacterium]|nr:BatA domain-containing protein [Ignavibacteriales bacterium]
MTFLNPIALFGLLAAGIPVLLHLLNLRKLKKIEFSTLTFLKELQKTQIRRVKLKQLLLLILRTFIIVLLVVGFSRPTLKGSLPIGLGERARTSAVIVIDDSFSMSARNEHGEYFRQAKDAALAIIDALKEGDEVVVVPMSSAHDQTAALTLSRNLPLVRAEVRDAQLSAITVSATASLGSALKLLESAHHPNKEVYVISDFQASLFASSASTDRHIAPPITAKLFLVHTGSGAIPDFAITNVDVKSSVFSARQPVMVQATIANYTSAAAQNRIVSVVLNGTRVAQKSVDIPQGGSVQTDFTVVPPSAGIVRGFVEIESDELEFNNRRFFSFHIPDQLRVLLVGQPDDLRYAELALRTSLSSESTTFNVAQTTVDRLSSGAIAQANVIALVNTSSLIPAQVDRLRAFLDQGGGAMLFAGPNVLPQEYAMLASALHMPDRSVRTPSEQASLPSLLAIESTGGEWQFDRTDFRHPLFAGMFQEEPTDRTMRPTKPRTIESPSIRTAARFAVTPTSNVLITLSNGAPFLVEQKLNGGRMLIFSIPPTRAWSDFPTTGLFVPMMHRSAMYLAGEQSKLPALRAGEEASLPMRTTSSPNLVVRTPKNLDVRVQIPARTNGIPSGQSRTLLAADLTHDAGNYQVFSDGKEISAYAVNVAAEESNTLPASAAQRSQWLTNAGIDERNVRQVQGVGDIAESITTARFGAELWKFFLIAALVVALIEMTVARATKHERLHSANG